jgi:CRISPR-associated DxTHG motif protein
MKLLVGALGTGTYHPTTYVLGDVTAEETAPAAALAGMLHPDRSVMVLTAHAAENPAWQGIEARLTELTGQAVEAVSVPDPESTADAWRVFEALVAAVQPEDEVILDVTFGFRSLPVLMLGSLVFLAGSGRARISGVYYAAHTPGAARTPLVDITAVVSLIDWAHAARTFRETGYVGRLTDIARSIVGDQRAQRAFYPINNAVAALDKAVGPLELGLSLEAGLALESAQRRIAQLHDAADPSLQPFLEVLGGIRDFVADLAVPQKLPKQEVALTRDELDREQRLIRWHLEHGRLAHALVLAREWMVSRVQFAREQTDGWLKRSARQIVERDLGALGHRDKSAPLATLWNDLTRLRNEVAHGGFRPQGSAVKPDRVRSALDTLWRLDAASDLWRLERTVTFGHTLLTPLGLTPGALFTALSRHRPDHLIVVTSRQAERQLPDILARAGVAADHTTALVDDPFGFAEAKSVWERLKQDLLAAEDLVVNMTGGTTVLQEIVAAIGREAERAGVPVCRGAAVDRRPFDRQKQEPFVVGEWLWLPDRLDPADGEV